ncbi:MAG TPA: hypothetical protein VFV29_00560 [Actinomycetota bacterium]|nr:hypothetical protein [Actinomycetota bacterium]
MCEEPRLRGLPTFGLAMAGLVLGHVLAYLIAVPDPHHRAFVLQRTGHEYLPAAAEAALVLALAGMAAVVIRAFGSGRRGGSDRFSRLAGRLGLVQVLAFGGLEVVERIVAGAPLRHLASDHILVIGMAMQIVVALAGAAFLRWLARTSSKLAETVLPRVPLPRTGAVPALASASWSPGTGAFGSIVNVRAPPSA